MASSSLVATNAMKEGLRTAAKAIERFEAGCDALRGQVGHEVVAEHLDLTLRRLELLRKDLEDRADRVENRDAILVALGVATAGLVDLGQAFAHMYRRYGATVPTPHPPQGWFDEDPAEPDVEGMPSDALP